MACLPTWWWGARWLLAFDAVVTLGSVIVAAAMTGGSALTWALDNNTLLAALEWLHVARTSLVMDTSKAKKDLGWQPTYTSAETLAALATR